MLQYKVLDNIWRITEKYLDTIETIFGQYLEEIHTLLGQYMDNVLSDVCIISFKYWDKI